MKWILRPPPAIGNAPRYDCAVPSEAYLRHFRDPQGQGSLPAPTHSATVTDPACGDELALDLEVEAGRIVAARFRVRGCSGAIAVGSALATLLPGREALATALRREELDAELGGVPPAKRHVLRLATQALAAALQNSSST
jgi:nitrogen fixation NifU-like protein